MQRPRFSNNQIYHIYNRGVEKRKVFLDDKDRLRFIHDLFEFNDKNAAPASRHRFKTQICKVEPCKFDIQEKKPRKLLVKILAFNLMPNHFHLLLEQKINKGVVQFMQKLGTGYAMYFNQKYNRVGSLFQGRFKAVLIEQEDHFVHIPYYIHLNPLDLIAPKWRKGEIRNYKEAINFLRNYRWSSYPDYIGKKNFPSVTQRDFLMKFFDGSHNYKKDTMNWLKNMNLNEIKEFIHE